MKISRMDLDATGSPIGLVSKILAVEKEIAVPIPLEELAKALDIIDIAELDSDGFEGGLLAPPERPHGIILVKRSISVGRRRFTIAHELGHFLMPSHTPNHDGQFLCSRDQMATWDVKHQDRYVRMEAEANQFAALLLMPPPQLRLLMQPMSKPCMADIVTVQRHFEVSMEAAVRSFIEYHPEPTAAILVENGKIIRFYKNRQFPFLNVRNGQAVPSGSVFHQNLVSEADACEPSIWIDGGRIELSEEIMRKGNYAVILLHAIMLDEDEDDDSEAIAVDRRWQR